MRKAIAIALLSFSSFAAAVQIHPVVTDGRQIQLDGFLFEWKKADSTPLGSAGGGTSLWSWGVINTREGLTGYFKAERGVRNSFAWQFRFLPRRLSPYSSMVLSMADDAGHRFYKVNREEGDRPSVEWIIPWDSIGHDSSGAYQVGLFGCDTSGGGDSLQPVIITGKVFHPAPPRWNGVYQKAVFVGVLMVMLFMLQRSTRATRGKFRKQKKVAQDSPQRRRDRGEEIK
jgi:hypothetical protein